MARSKLSCGYWLRSTTAARSSTPSTKHQPFHRPRLADAHTLRWRRCEEPADPHSLAAVDRVRVRRRACSHQLPIRRTSSTCCPLATSARSAWSSSVSIGSIMPGVPVRASARLCSVGTTASCRAWTGEAKKLYDLLTCPKTWCFIVARCLRRSDCDNEARLVKVSPPQAGSEGGRARRTPRRSAPREAE